MFAKYTKELFSIMVKAGFTILDEELSRTVISDDTSHIVLHKRDNTIHYVVALFNTDKFNTNEYNKVKLDLAKRLNNHFIGQIYTGVIVTNIFIGEDLPIVENTIANAEKYIDQFYYEVYWGVKESENSLVHRVSKNQPSDILGFKKMIFKAYKNYKSDSLQNKNLSMSATISKIKSENPLKVVTKYSNLTFLIFLICIIYFFIEQYFLITVIPSDLKGIDRLGYKNYIFLELGALQRSKVLIDGEYYRLISSLFMHSDFIHLSFNLLALMVFGGRLERYMGPIHLGLIFLVGGLVGNFFTVMLMENVSVGASGSIFAIIGALYVLSKRFNKEIDGLSSNVFFIYILVNVCLGFLISNVNNVAHIGGLLFGLFAGFVYKPNVGGN